MKRNIVIAAVTAAALIGGGAATALAATADDEGPARQADTRPSDDDTGDRDDAPARASVTGVTAPQAIASALRDTAGTVVSAELDDEDDDGRTVWEVDVLTPDDTWRSVAVDAGTGKVVDTHTENDEDEGTTAVRSALKGASVTAADAAKAVAGEAGRVTSVDLDEDGRSPGWEVESHGSGKGEGRDWLVDLKTAKVTPDHDDD
jgi:uncharacterized membrane protein YkoI